MKKKKSKRLKPAIQNMIAGFDAKKAGRESTPAYANPVTIWLPLVHKKKYDRLQMRSNRQFVKLLRTVILEIIDQVE